MHVHGKVHHVGVAEQVQLALQHVLFIIQLEKKQITNNDSTSKWKWRMCTTISLLMLSDIFNQAMIYVTICIFIILNTIQLWNDIKTVAQTIFWNLIEGFVLAIKWIRIKIKMCTFGVTMLVQLNWRFCLGSIL